MHEVERAAIVGGGVIGRSWAVVFARAGLSVTVYERLAEARATMPARFADMVRESAALCGDADAQAATLARIAVSDSLEAAVVGAGFVHECIDEKLDSKRAIFAELDRLCDPSAILATTTSSFPVSSFAADLPGRGRCIVVHPATPPHLLPVTEICPAPFTDPAVTDACFALMERCRQVPVLIRFEQSGFVLNRMQAALIVEMLRCVNSGIISPGDVDKIITHGFGLRWAFLGPFEGVDLNAVGGIREYLGKYGFSFDDMAKQNGHDGTLITEEVVTLLEDYARAQVPLEALPARTAWRDRSIVALRALRMADLRPNST